MAQSPFDQTRELEQHMSKLLEMYIRDDIPDNTFARELVNARAAGRQLGIAHKIDQYMTKYLSPTLERQAPDKYQRFISYIQSEHVKAELYNQLEQQTLKDTTQIYSAQDVRDVQRLVRYAFQDFKINWKSSEHLKNQLAQILKDYPQDMARREVMLELERHGMSQLYTQLTEEHNSNKNKFPEAKLNIENSRALWDNLLEDFSLGQKTMLGRDYIQPSNPDRTFRHMSNLLTELWNRENRAPHDRFDPVSRFQNDLNRLADHINYSFDKGEIDRAHDYLQEQYRKRGRGRPKGSKNRPKYNRPDPLLSELQDSILETTEASNSAATAAEQAETKIDWDAPEQKQETQQAPKLDLSDLKRDLAEDMRDHVENVLQLYVSHTQLAEKRYINAEQAGAIFKPIHERLKAHIEEEFKKLNALVPRELVIVTPENVKHNMGVQHVHFSELLQMVQSRVSNDGGRCNIWLYGPAGTGKTTAAKNVAKALGMKFYIQSSLIADFQVIGHWDAHGKYSRTLFREAWEHGGIIMLDEIDAYQPSAAMALNGMLANGVGAFPDGMIERHKDCIIIAGANTTGLGASFDYVGRNKLDAATLDRFVFLDWPIDDVLEEHICNIPSWLLLVREVRSNVGRGDQTRFKGVMITPRATIYGESLLRAGLSVDRVIKSTLKKGMSDAQWNMIKPSASVIDMVQSEVTAAIHKSAADVTSN